MEKENENEEEYVGDDGKKKRGTRRTRLRERGAGQWGSERDVIRCNHLVTTFTFIMLLHDI